jgi:hypothetical protein
VIDAFATVKPLDRFDDVFVAPIFKGGGFEIGPVRVIEIAISILFHCNPFKGSGAGSERDLR